MEEIPEYLRIESRREPPAIMPTDTDLRNDLPMATGCLDYFPLALAYISYVSKVANEQHNPGQPMHWARGKSTAHADKLLKHLVERGRLDVDGLRHSGKVGWRALALLQQELEDAGWGGPGLASIFPPATQES